MFKNEIEAYFESFSTLKSLSVKQDIILSPEEFNSTMTNMLTELLTNSEDFYKMEFLKEKSETLFNDYLTRISFESDECREILSDFFLMAIFYIASADYIKTEEARIFFTFSQDAELFYKETLPRIQNLRSQLEEKHSTLKKVISTQFNNFISELEKEVKFLDEYLRSLNSLETNGLNITETLFPNNQQGRPYDLFIDLVLLSLYDTAKKVNPKKYYSKVIIPSMVFLAEIFPDILDAKDYINYENLRKRMGFIQKKYCQEDAESPLPGE